MLGFTYDGNYDDDLYYVVKILYTALGPFIGGVKTVYTFDI